MTVAEAIRDAARRLASASDTARLDAELLMAHALGVSRSDMLLRQMTSPVPPAFARMIDRRAGGEPVAYITGVQEFYGREFRVNSDVLIPRPDSEVVVEAALDALAEGESRTVLDLGTGSGALLLTLLAERHELIGTGMDASAGAIRVASENAQRLNLASRAEMLHRAWTDESRGTGWTAGLGPFDLIIANPPYVEEDALLDRSVRDFEPASALFAGRDGLDDYRIIIPGIRAMGTRVAVLEIGARQGEAVCRIAQDAGFSTEIRHDLAKRPRVVVLR